jgi:hypothetical protein
MIKIDSLLKRRAHSLALAPSANLNPERRYPSLFQASYDSALDIMGKGIARLRASGGGQNDRAGNEARNLRDLWEAI